MQIRSDALMRSYYKANSQQLRSEVAAIAQ
jgi:hypothetical protein